MTSLAYELADMPAEWIGDDLRQSAAAHDAAQARRRRLEQHLDAAVGKLNDTPEASLDHDLEVGGRITAAERALAHLRVPEPVGVDEAVEMARRELVGASADIELREPAHRAELRDWARHLSSTGSRTALPTAASIVGTPSDAEIGAGAEFDELIGALRGLRGLEDEFRRSTGMHALGMGRGVRDSITQIRERVAEYVAHLEQAEAGRVAHPLPGTAAAVGVA